MPLDLKSLEIIYRNSMTSEELDLSLEFHGITREELANLAMEHGWETSPIAIRNFAGQVEPLLEADSENIEKSNKASVRRCNAILEHLITKFQLEMSGISTIAAIESLETLIKIREKLTKLEYPMYGLSTIEPPAPINPINLFLTENAPPLAEEDGGQKS